jgi:hypothetical protein
MINQFIQSYCETPHATESNLHRVEYGAGKPFSRVRTSLLFFINKEDIMVWCQEKLGSAECHEFWGGASYYCCRHCLITVSVWPRP